MKILIICNHGKNRSKYLAEYLSKKGYVTEYAGSLLDLTCLEKKITDADIIVTVHQSVIENLKNIDLKNKRIINLDVEDRPEVVLGKQLDGDEWLDFQKKHVYPALTKEIDKYLPF